MEWEQALFEIEAYLRIGKRLEAQNKLVKTLDKPEKIPRKYHAKLAELSRRSGRSRDSLQLLYKWVRGRGRNLNQATVLEKEEYAGALIALRAMEEAELILEELKSSDSPKTFLFLAMASINRWNYQKAIEYLTMFLSFEEISDYDRSIGAVNLIASEVAVAEERINRKLEQRIDTLLLELERKEYKVLYSNLLEIRTQFILKVSKSYKTTENLKRAESIINDPKSKENLFLQKWQLISRKPDLRSSKTQKEKWLLKMRELQERAKEINHSETIRDADFHMATFDEDLMEKVYFGTPYESYRERIIEEFNLNLPAAFWWDLGSHSKKFEFDYLKYKDLKVGALTQKLIKALTKDFYRRVNMFTLFSMVFPEDYYNPESSFNKLHQIVSRARIWLLEKKIPLEIVEENGEYFLRGEVSIKIYLNDVEKIKLVDEEIHYYINLIKKEWEARVFSIHELVTKLSFKNIRKAQRFLEKARELNLIDRMGKGKNTLYYLLT